jgi:hypothetical protein
MTLYVAFALIAGLGTLVAARARRSRTSRRPDRVDRAHMATRIEDRRRSGETDYWAGGLF